MASTYAIWLYTPTGAAIQLFSSFTSLQMTRTVNGNGSLSLVVPGTTSASYIQQDSMIEVMRTPPGGINAQRVFGTRFFVTAFTRYYQGAALMYAIDAVPAVQLIGRRIVAYASGTSQASKTGFADDLIKAIVRENFGSSATAVRDISAYMSVAANLGAGASVSKSFAWQRVESTIQALTDASAAATPSVSVFYDVVYDDTAAKFSFVTYTGQLGRDRGSTSAAPMYFSIGNRNITNPSIVADYTDEVNSAYAGGQGTGSDRLITTTTDSARAAASPYNLRETFVDARSYSTTTGLADEGNEALYSARPLTVFSGDILTGTGSEFQTAWDYGDKVAASFLNATFDCWVKTVSVSVAGGNETVSAKLRGIS